jgi:hypothetical protein
MSTSSWTSEPPPIVSDRPAGASSYTKISTTNSRRGKYFGAITRNSRRFFRVFWREFPGAASPQRERAICHFGGPWRAAKEHRSIFSLISVTERGSSRFRFLRRIGLRIVVNQGAVLVDRLSPSRRCSSGKHCLDHVGDRRRSRRRSHRESLGAVRLVSRGLAPAWIGSGGRNRGFDGK